MHLDSDGHLSTQEGKLFQERRVKTSTSETHRLHPDTPFGKKLPFLQAYPPVLVLVGITENCHTRFFTLLEAFLAGIVEVKNVGTP
jgi:hypothetical protein